MVSLGMKLQMASGNTMLQTIVDDKQRGRVKGFYTVAYMGTAHFGSFLTGSLEKIIGILNTIIIIGISRFPGALFFLHKLPEITKVINSHNT